MNEPTEKDRESARSIVNEYFRISEQDRPMPFAMRVEWLLTTIAQALADARDSQREEDAKKCDAAAKASRQEAKDDAAYRDEAEASEYQAVMAESLAAAIRNKEQPK